MFSEESFDKLHRCGYLDGMSQVSLFVRPRWSGVPDLQTGEVGANLPVLKFVPRGLGYMKAESPEHTVKERVLL